MIEQQIRDVFAATADSEPGPSQVDVRRAHRQGRARLRWRRAGLAGAAALAAAVAVVAALVVVVPAEPAPGPETGGAPAPRQFSPLITNASFGWLPAGVAVTQGYVDPGTAFLVAAGGQAGSGVELAVYARGQCQLTDQASSLKCVDMGLGSTARLGERAPDVNGRAAYWAGSGLIWSYARGGWASLTSLLGLVPLRHSPALQAEALKIARNVRFGAATTHLAFPVQFTGLTSGWRVADASFVADSGKLRVEKYTLRTASSRILWPSPGADSLWSNAVFVAVQQHGTCVLNDPATRRRIEIINGARVIVKHTLLRHPDPDHPAQALCAAHAGGLWFEAMEYNLHPPLGVVALFRHHVRLLGRNPANWTQNPIG
jgi:hypothetical protein